MTKMKPEDRRCKLELLLSWCGSIETRYDSIMGMSRRFLLKGRVYDYDDEFRTVRSKFHDEPAAVSVSSSHEPDDQKWKGLRTLAGVTDICGQLKTETRPKTEEFEDKGETFVVEAVDVDLFVDSGAFEAIYRQASESHERSHTTHMTVKLAGKNLPEPVHGRGVWV